MKITDDFAELDRMRQPADTASNRIKLNDLFVTIKQRFGLALAIDALEYASGHRELIDVNASGLHRVIREMEGYANAPDAETIRGWLADDGEEAL